MKNKRRIIESREIKNIGNHPKIRRSGLFRDSFNFKSPFPQLSLKPSKIKTITDTDLSLDRKMKNCTAT